MVKQIALIEFISKYFKLFYKSSNDPLLSQSNLIIVY